MNGTRTDPADDRFSSVLGTGRGIPEADLLRAEVSQLRAELRTTKSRMTEAIRATTGVMGQLDALDNELMSERAGHVLARRDHQRLRFERDAARSALVRSGVADPTEELDFVHHGIWTPGRPYLHGQYVFWPAPEKLWRTKAGGAPVGARPGRSSHWALCTPKDFVPGWKQPDDSGRRLGGFFPREYHPWRGFGMRTRRLADDAITHAIASLRACATDEFAYERSQYLSIEPCPVWAYPDSMAWIRDMPLMRALLTERRRRKRQNVWTLGRGLTERSRLATDPADGNGTDE